MAKIHRNILFGVMLALATLLRPAGATVESQLYADTYFVNDAGRTYSVLDVYAKGTHLGDTIGGTVLGLTGHSVSIRTSLASAAGDIFVHGGSVGNGWLPTDDLAASWDSFIAVGNRSQGTRGRVTNRAGVLIAQGVDGSWGGGTTFTQIRQPNSSFIDEGAASGWYSTKGGNPYLAAAASENPFARVSLYNSTWNAVYGDLYRGPEVLVTKGPLQQGRASAAGDAVLSGAAGMSLEFHWMVGRFAIDITDRAGQEVTMKVQFNMVGKNGAGTNNETGTTFSGAVASTTAYKVSNHFTFARPPAPVIGTVSPATGPETGGTTITISGAHMSGVTEVLIGGSAATAVTVTSPSTVTAVTPAGSAGPRSVTVIGPGGSAFAAGAFSYAAVTVPSARFLNLDPTFAKGLVIQDLWGVAAEGGAIVAGSSSGAVRWTPAGGFDPISPPAGISQLDPTLISDDGRVISGRFMPSGSFDFRQVRGFRWQVGDATAVDIGSIGDRPFVEPHAMSADGAVIVGEARTTHDTNRRAFRLKGGVMTDLGGLAGRPESCANLVSATGAVVFGYSVLSGDWLESQRAWRWSGGVLSPVGPLSGDVGSNVLAANRAGTAAAGLSWSAAGVTRGFRWMNGTITNIASFPADVSDGGMVDISEDGSVVVGWYQRGGRLDSCRAVRWTPSTGLVDLGNWTPRGMSSDGRIVVGTRNSNSGSGDVSVIWTPTAGLRDLRDILASQGIDVSGIFPSSGVGISDDGNTLFGNFQNQSGESSVFRVTGLSLVPIGPPSIVAVSPPAGPTEGGTSITITGTNLLGTSDVLVGGQPATSISVVDSNTVSVVTPSGTSGAKSVVLTTSGGTATKANAFTYVGVPTVTGVTPVAGPVAGNTLVTITGTNFTTVGGVPTVTVGGVACTNVVVSSATKITARTPAGAAGSKDVVVTTVGGTGTKANGYTQVDAPTVTGVTPVGGRVTAGVPVTITGTNLSGATSVKFGAALATGVVVAGDGLSLTALAPAGSVGVKAVAVTTAGGAATLAGGYTYVGAPTISVVSPAAGPLSAGTPITIAGTNFTLVGGAPTVTVGGVSCTDVSVVSATTITAKAPAGAVGPKSVVVTTVGGTATRANAYTYVASPAISAMGPAFGPVTGGTTLTISGSGLSGATVRVGGVLCTGVSATATGITARTPAGTAGPKDVVVTTAGGTATQAGGFTYAAVPTVSGVAPVAGPLSAGTPITVTGTGFTDLGGVVAVKVGTASCTDVVVVNATTITAVAPAGAAGVKAVVVTTAGGTATKASGYTHVAAPTVTGSTPVAGPVAGNTLITIAGTNFTAVGGAPTVTVGGVACTSVVVSSATKITARTPAGTSGSKALAVTTVGGTGTKANGYTYAGVPTVTGVTPSSGPLAAGTSITVTGTNFTSAGVAATVKVGGVSCTSVVVVNATTITAKAPAGTAGAKDLVVTTVGGTGTGAGAYTYVGTPTIATVSPSSGPTSGGTVITITGTNLSTVTSVKVGGVSCTGVVVVNATTIQATTPTSTIGAKAVVVTTAGGTATRAGGFTYTASLTGGMGAPKPRGSGAVGGGTASEAGVVDAMPEWEALVRSLPVESGRCVRWILEGVQDAPVCEAVDCADAISWEPDESVPDEMDWDGNGVSDLCQMRCGDLDLDGLIDFSDLAVLTGMYGLKPALGVGDLDGDGEIGNSDAALLLERIGAEASGS